jgi:disulfide bond formation protein DsbB
VNEASWIWTRLVAVVSISAVFASLIAEYGYGMPPCRMCIWQRWLWGAVFAAVLTGSIGIPPKIKAYGPPLALIALCGISAFHSAAVLGWITIPCPAPAVNSMAEFEAMLTLPSPCSRSALSVLGIPAPWVSLAVASLLLMERLRPGTRGANRKQP